jgi:16S rRNA (uracil1498-N3)-methyltransferase
MQRFFITPDLISADSIRFPTDISHQIRHVLRLQAGDEVEAACGDGWIYRVKLMDSPDEFATGSIFDKYQAETEPDIDIHLFFGLTRREKAEWIIQKGTEVGVSAFHPYISRRTLVQEIKLNNKRQERWERIIREAAEQSKRGKIPFLNSPDRLADALSDLQGGIILAAVVGDQTRDLKALLSEICIEREVYVIVGPEGGFDPEEIQGMVAVGAHFFSMGKRVLRMETAAIIAPAILLHELGEMGASK